MAITRDLRRKEPISKEGFVDRMFVPAKGGGEEKEPNEEEGSGRREARAIQKTVAG